MEIEDLPKAALCLVLSAEVFNKDNGHSDGLETHPKAANKATFQARHCHYNEKKLKQKTDKYKFAYRECSSEELFVKGLDKKDRVMAIKLFR